MDEIDNMIEKELNEIRQFINAFDNSPGREPSAGLSDIREALRPVLVALEKLERHLDLSQSDSTIMTDPDGDRWEFSAESRTLYFDVYQRFVDRDGQIRRRSDNRSIAMIAEWRKFFLKAWEHCTGEHYD